MGAEVWCGLAKALPAFDAGRTGSDLLLETDFDGSPGTHIFTHMQVGKCTFVCTLCVPTHT